MKSLGHRIQSSAPPPVTKITRAIDELEGVAGLGPRNIVLWCEEADIPAMIASAELTGRCLVRASSDTSFLDTGAAIASRLPWQPSSRKQFARTLVRACKGPCK